MGTFHMRGWARRAFVQLSVVFGALVFAGAALAHEDDYKGYNPDCGGSKPACDPYSGGGTTTVPSRYLVQRQTFYQQQYVTQEFGNPCVPGDGPIVGTGRLETWTTMELYSDGDTKFKMHGRLSGFNGRATMRDFLPSTNGAFYTAFSDNTYVQFDDGGSLAESRSINSTFRLNRRCDYLPEDDFYNDVRLEYRVNSSGVVVVDKFVNVVRCK